MLQPILLDKEHEKLASSLKRVRIAHEIITRAYTMCLEFARNGKISQS